MGHLFHFAARFPRLLEIGVALYERKPGVSGARSRTVRYRWMATGAAGFLALVALALVGVSPGTFGGDDNVASAHTPACPSSLPTADGESFWTDTNDDEWYIIRETSNSGYTTVQAYVASDDYDSGYVPSSPHETCVLKVRGPDDDADLDPPVQIFFPNDDDDDDSSSSNTQTTPEPSASFSLSEASDDSETTGVASVGLAWFAYYGTEVTIAIALTDLEADADADTVDYHFRVRVKQGTTIDLLCQGAGMNDIRELTTNTGSSIQTATIPGTCPVGTYTIEVELADGDDTDLSDPIAEGTGYLVIGLPPGSETTGQTGSQSGDGNGGNNGNGGQGGQNNGGQGGGNGGDNNNGGSNNGGNGQNNRGGGNNGGGGTTVVMISECGAAARGSTGTPDRPLAPNLVVTQDNSRVGVEWKAPNDNGNGILGYTIMYVPKNGIRTVIEAGGLSEIITDLTAETTYEIRVSGCNSVGFSNWSQGAELITASNPGTPGENTVGTVNNAWCGVAQAGSTGTPGTPDAPTVTVNGTSITVQWTEPDENGGSVIKMYAIQYTPASGKAKMVKVMTGMTDTLTGLIAGTDYLVQVAACNAVGMSRWSQSESVRTQGTAPNPVPTQTSDDGNNGNGDQGTNTENDPNGNGGANTEAGEDPTDYRPIVTSRCGSGEWVGHHHTNDSNYWGGTVGCLDGNLIDSIDDIDPDTAGSQHGRMWTSVGWSDHKHYSQDGNGNWVIVSDIYDHDGDGNPDNNSCNAFHIAAHTGLGVNIKPGCGP